MTTRDETPFTKRLREVAAIGKSDWYGHDVPGLLNEAAARIENGEAEVEQLRQLRDAAEDHLVVTGPCDGVDDDTDDTACGDPECTYCAMARAAMVSTDGQRRSRSHAATERRQPLRDAQQPKSPAMTTRDQLMFAVRERAYYQSDAVVARMADGLFDDQEKQQP